MSKATEFFTAHKKAILITLGIVIFLILLFCLYWFVIRKKDTSELLIVNQANLSYPVNQYGIFADNMEASMQAAGKDFGKTMGVLNSMQNGDDLKQMIKAFGKRTNYAFFLPKYDANVIYWLGEEYKGDDLAEIRERFLDLNVAF